MLTPTSGLPLTSTLAARPITVTGKLIHWRMCMHKRIFLSVIVLLSLSLAVPAFADSQGQFDRTLKVTGAPDIEVSTGSGDIKITTGDTSTVHVVGHIRASNMSSWFGGGGSSEEKIKRLETNPPI